MNEFEALISMESYLGDRMGRLKYAVKKLMQQTKILKISSIYEIVETADVLRGPSTGADQSDRWADGLSVALLLSTTIGPRDLLKFLQAVEHQTNSATRCVDIDLLFYEDKSCISPLLTIPHPELHRRPQVLIPAAEIYGDHIHPVLELPLRQLTERFSKKKWGQFYFAGHSLLDF